MKHKTWFRLVVKAIGLLFIVFTLPQVLAFFIGLVFWWLEIANARGMGSDMWLWNWQYQVGAAAQLVVGLYLFFGGKWIVNRCIPSNRPYCPECGYDLTHSRNDRCGECGVLLPPTSLIAINTGRSAPRDES